MSQITLTQKSREETIILQPSKGWSALNLGDLWRYRELIYFLTWRDILVRYKQTVLGVFWAVLQPFVTMVVFTFLFNRLGRISSDNIPYPLFSFTGLLPWGLFSKALTDAGRSLIANRSMITKVYFPRLAIPIGSVLGGLLDFFFALLVLIGMMVYYNYFSADSFQIALTSRLWFLPLFLLLALAAALGVGLWLSALNALYRDINYLLPFLTQLWLLVSPIAYPVSKIPENFRLIASLNPMTGVIEGFRWALLGTETTTGPMFAISISITLLLLVGGLFYFRRMERTFADMV